MTLQNCLNLLKLEDLTSLTIYKPRTAALAIAVYAHLVDLQAEATAENLYGKNLP